MQSFHNLTTDFSGQYLHLGEKAILFTVKLSQANCTTVGISVGYSLLWTLLASLFQQEILII